MRFLLPLLLLVALGCGERGHSGRAGHAATPGRYDARGIVVSVDREYAQVVIDHEDVAGLMPGMTMSFDVPDARLLERLAPGQKIEFEIEFTGRAYRVTAAEVVGTGGSRAQRLGLDGALPVDQPAADFALIDQEGHPLALGDLRGNTLLIDFVYTHCPGPCPIQTGVHVEAQAALPPEVRDRVHFVSISLDPTRDTPGELKAYALSHGADLASWSFLTGDVDAVAHVLDRYGIGRVPGAGGEIEHMLVTYLVDAQGLVIKRYVGLEHEPGAIAADLARVASATSGG